MTEVGCVLDARSMLGEGPLWDPQARVLYWVDIKRREITASIRRAGGTSNGRRRKISGSLAARQGGLVVAMKTGFHVFDPATATFTPVFDPERHLPGNRFNDGKPDRRGRFWAAAWTTPRSRRPAALYRPRRRLHLQAHGRRHNLLERLVLEPRRSHALLRRQLHASDLGVGFDIDAGEISNRRVFVEVPPSREIRWRDRRRRGRRVGGALGGWRGHPLRSQGRVDRVVEMPVQKPTCPMFGGPNLDILYFTSASIQLTPDELKQQPQAGSIFAFEPGVRGGCRRHPSAVRIRLQFVRGGECSRP
jgi:sugar lactone lactonase YvrE